MSHSFVPQTLDPRSAGKVTRFHTWERLRDQSVGEHTWQLMRILLAICDRVPRHVLIYAMFHDVGERVTGDVPYPVKAENPEVKEAFDDMEQRALDEMLPWGVLGTVTLSPEEKQVFKLAEFIEMWEYALDEIALGNSNCSIIAARCHEQAVRLLAGGDIPPHIHNRTVAYMRRRRDHERTHRQLHHQFRY